MSHQCEFCDTEFTARKNLLRHQKTVAYCLDKQRERGLTIPAPEYVCSCGQAFRLRQHLTQHRERCGDTSLSVVNNTQNIQTQNNLTINIYGTTASSLTAEAVAEKVLAVISMEAVEAGVAEMTKEVAPNVFRNEKGTWNLRVADASRKKLLVRTDEGEESDRQGERTTMLLRAPFLQASFTALEQGAQPRKVESTIEEIEDDETYVKKSTGALLKVVPDKFASSVALTDDREESDHDRAYRKASAKAKRVLAKLKRERIEELRLLTERSKEDFLEHSQDLHDGTFWHPIHRFVIQLDAEHDFSIMGKREKRGDQTLPLTRADLKFISDMGLRQWVAPEFADRLEAAV